MKFYLGLLEAVEGLKKVLGSWIHYAVREKCTVIAGNCPRDSTGIQILFFHANIFPPLTALRTSSQCFSRTLTMQLGHSWSVIVFLVVLDMQSCRCAILNYAVACSHCYRLPVVFGYLCGKQRALPSLLLVHLIRVTISCGLSSLAYSSCPPPLQEVVQVSHFVIRPLSSRRSIVCVL